MSTWWTNGHRGLKSTSWQQRSGQYSLTSHKNFPRSSSWRKNSLSQHFFTILIHSRWTNDHFMGKWGQGLKIDLRATKQRTVLFNLAQEFYPAHPLQEKIRQVSIFSKSCFIPGEQMSTLWANGHRGLKSTLWQQSSGQYSLTSHKNFPRSSSSRKNSLSQHFFTILLHSRWTNVHLMDKWTQGLKIDLMATKQRTVLFNLAQEFSPLILFKKKFAKSAFFHNFASFQVNKWPLYGQMGTGG